MMKQLNFQSDYLSRQIISYIGNKRRLLPFIAEALQELTQNNIQGNSFFDGFAGSGAVSRLAKAMGFSVMANDWEPYSFYINSCYLQSSPAEVNGIFKDQGGIQSLVNKLNHLDDPDPEQQYFAKYYAPKSMDPTEAEIGRERLFYTRENALILDKIRLAIEEMFPEDTKARSILLGPLLYLASKHTNTSGVFKAYHKGFGGLGKDALQRILSPIIMEAPALIDSNYEHQVFQRDISILADELDPLEFAYLDPPYNQHQYGSNYHILNSLALWDRIPQPLEYKQNGELARKAAIREDWVQTRSSYCRKQAAPQAFSELISKLKARYILISYSSDGIIPFQEMRSICEGKGRLSLLSNPYTVYRGGRQSRTRRNGNLEFLWVIDTERTNNKKSREKLEQQWLKKEIHMISKGVMRLEGLELEDRCWQFQRDGYSVIALVKNSYSFEGIEIPEDIPSTVLEEYKEVLQGMLCSDREDELDYLCGLLDDIKRSDRRSIMTKVLQIIRKLAHRKYQDQFYQWCSRIEDLLDTFEEGSLHRQWDKLQAQAAKRLSS